MYIGGKKKEKILIGTLKMKKKIVAETLNKIKIFCGKYVDLENMINNIYEVTPSRAG